MTVERMVELLEIEKECVLRNASGECNRYCAGCDLLQDDTELHEMYTEALALLKAQDVMVMAGAELTDAELIEKIRKAPLVLKQNVDAVTVVRCRDCKYYAINRLTKAYEPDKRFNPSVCIIGEFARPRKPDFYCADGEQRDDDA